jgi:Flp pilus assembly protein TadG
MTGKKIFRHSLRCLAQNLPGNLIPKNAGNLIEDDRASQIVEFALSLPLLVFFVIGIFDFSNALALKQKLVNAARESARVAAADPASDLANPSTTVPASVSDAVQVVDNYLISENINDCGLSSTAATVSGLQWTYAANTSGCPGSGLSLTIDRGCKSVATTGAGTVNLIGTCITLMYAYKWEFNNVASVLGWTGSGPTNLTALAGAYNEN